MSSQVSLGPVQDLETCLPGEWWQTLFDALYLRTDGDVVENPANTLQDVDLLVQAAGLSPHHRVLDLCCGQGRHSLELARRGFGRVVGVDHSPFLIELARQRAAGHTGSPRFLRGEARQLPFAAASFDGVAMMGNSFGYFARQDDDLALLEETARILRPGGVLVLDLADGGWLRRHWQPRSWEWLDHEQLVCRERQLAEGDSRLVCRELVVAVGQGVIADRFYAERLYSREQAEEQLLRAGFGDVRDHGDLGSASGRNQDLGMMAHRFFLTARSLASPRQRRPLPVRRPVTVLLGDAGLPDPLKRGQRFNPEDLETLARLKAALAELGEYRFRYLERHAVWVDELRANPPELVFNLCDEGFANRAEHELHVPAFLDLLGVPYTGSGPAALAICYDKELVAGLAAAQGIPVPRQASVEPGGAAVGLNLPFPLLVKPARGDGGRGITQGSVVHNPRQLQAHLDGFWAAHPGERVLVQEFLGGTEISVGVLGNPGGTFHLLPILQVDYSGLPSALPPILGYESKWEPQSPYWTQVRHHQAKLGPEVVQELEGWVRALWDRLGCRDYARFDFRADAGGNFRLLEVNPNPGWCWDGKLNLMAGWAGLTYADLLRQILAVSQARLA